MKPITILKAGSVVLANGGIALIGWTVDTGGRGPMQDCIGEVLIAARDFINKSIEDMMKTLPESAFDSERIAAAKLAAEYVWRKV